MAEAASMLASRVPEHRVTASLVSTEFVERIRAVGDRRGYSSKLTASESAVKSRINPILIVKMLFHE
jgi:hypothetical protein